MATVLPLSGLELIIDKQEKDLNRRNYIRNYFEDKGGDASLGSLNDYDYRVVGEYRGIPVDVGIEYKRIDDLLGNWKRLQTRFAKAIQHTSDIAIFIEGPVKIHQHFGAELVSRQGNHVKIRLIGSKKSYVINPYAPEDEVGELLPYTTYQSKLAQWQEVGVQVRQFDELNMFGDSVLNLLGHLVPTTKHPYLELPKTDYRRERFLWYQTIPRIGADTAMKLAAFPLHHWIDNVDLLVEAIKPARTKRLLDFVGMGE